MLCAGRGHRMLPLTRQKPISLLKLKKDLTVLDLQIKSLKEAGIGEIIIVLGYRSAMFKKQIKKYRHPNIRTIFNPFFEEADNLVSLWMAREMIQGQTVILNGDNLFHPEVIKQLNKNRSPVCVTIDKKDCYSAEEMKVGFIGGKLAKIDKEIPPNTAAGRSVGIIRFTDQGANWMREALEVEVEKNSSKKSFWLEAVQRIIEQKKKVDFIEIHSRLWQELDYPSQLKQARKNIKFFLS